MRDGAVIALVLAAALAIAFAPFLFGNSTLLSSAGEQASLFAGGANAGHGKELPRGIDTTGQAFSEPLPAALHRMVFTEHAGPFWDNVQAYGRPFVAAVEPQVFYPPAMIVAVHPSPRTWAIYVVLRLYLAGLFAAFFVYLFTREPIAAIGAGIPTMFTGYYLLFYGMPFLSGDIGLPMLLWATEIVLRRQTGPRIGALAVACALELLGGGPEPAFLAFAITALYALVRLWTLRERGLRCFAALVAGGALGGAVAAVQLLPFFEFIPLAFTVHGPATLTGLLSDHSWQPKLFSEFFPTAFGRIFDPAGLPDRGSTGLRGAFDCVPFFLACVAVVASWRKRDGRTAVVTFLAAIALWVILRRFGNPAVVWTSALPIMRRIDLLKYLESELGLCVALLCGFGIGYLRELQSKPLTLFAAGGVTLALITYLFASTAFLVPAESFGSPYGAALTIGLTAFVAAGVAAYVALSSGAARWRLIAVGALVGVTYAEAFAASVVPLVWGSVPSAQNNTYAGAPYTRYLQAHVDPTTQRVLGMGGTLFPNWGSAFGIPDVKLWAGLVPAEYLPFVQAFLQPTDATGDAIGWFNGLGVFDPTQTLFRRWMAISSIGYYITPIPRDFLQPPPGSVLADIVQRMNTLYPGGYAPFSYNSAMIGGKTERVFFDHPNNALTLELMVSRARPFLNADIGEMPEAYAHQPCGGPVTFTLRAARGARSVVQQRTIDPAWNTRDRRWFPIALDMRGFAGTTASVTLATRAPDVCRAWAVWGEPRFAARPAREALAQIPYRVPLAFVAPGSFVFRLPDAVPRLALFHRIRVAATPASALTALTSPSFDVHREAVVAAALPVAPAHGVDRVVTTRLTDDALDADVDAGSNAVLVQNDTFYPGWQAALDGRPVAIVPADAMFRAIAIPAGHHRLTLRYRSRTVAAGITVSCVALAMLLLCFLWPAVAVRRRAIRAR